MQGPLKQWGPCIMEITERYCVDSCNSEKYALCYFKAFSRDSKKCDSNKTEIAFSLVQGPSWQSAFFELTLTDRNMQVRFF